MSLRRGALLLIVLCRPLALGASSSPQALSPDASSQGLSTDAEALLQGQVFELGSPDPLSEPYVMLLGITRSVSGDSKGHYSLSVPSGPITVQFMAEGHGKLKRKFDLKPGQQMHFDAYLIPVDLGSEDLVISADKDRPQVIQTTLVPDEIKRIPGTGGDALRAIQDLPGIAVISDYSTQLAIQGGGPNDSLYLLDGIPWPFPFHFGGIVSTVDPNLLKSVDLFGAGYDARWGGALSAIINGHTGDNERDAQASNGDAVFKNALDSGLTGTASSEGPRFHVSSEISDIMAELHLDGPLGFGDGNFTMSVRRSYLELVLGLVNRPSSSSSSNGSSASINEDPEFWDASGSFDFSLGRDNKFHGLILGNGDTLNLSFTPSPTENQHFAGDFNLDNSALTSGVVWTNTTLPDLKSVLTLYGYDESIMDDFGTAFNINDQMRSWGLKEDAVWEYPKGQELSFGFAGQAVDYSTLAYIYDVNPNNPTLSQAPVATTVTGQSFLGSAYLQDRIELPARFALTAGVHYDRDSLVADDELTPRFNLQWKESDATTWSAAWGLYDQYPTGFETNPDFGNTGLQAEMASHTVLALDEKFSQELSARVDAYYKDIHSLVENNPELNYDNSGNGDVKGAELFLKEDLGEKFFGWISYAYSKSEVLTPPTLNWQPFEYDQSNILTVLASYDFTPAWGIGLRLHYNTGPLVQSFQGYYPGTTTPMTSSTYNQRLGDYLRLDARGEHSFLLRGWKIKVFLEILNLTNRQNPAGLIYPDDGSDNVTVYNNLPRFPYLGADFTY